MVCRIGAENESSRLQAQQGCRFIQDIGPTGVRDRRKDGL
jgi:hypothetical protein